jgi:UrcA family protein
MTKNTIIARSLLTLAAALATAPLAAGEPVVVTAQPTPSVHQQRVDFADLDLRRSKARQTLFRRVMDAAQSVCIAAEGKRSAVLAFGDSQGNCPNSTYRAARPQIMAAIHRANSGLPHTAAAVVIAAPARAR